MTIIESIHQDDFVDKENFKNMPTNSNSNDIWKQPPSTKTKKFPRSINRQSRTYDRPAVKDDLFPVIGTKLRDLHSQVENHKKATGRQLQGQNIQISALLAEKNSNEEFFEYERQAYIEALNEVASQQVQSKETHDTTATIQLQDDYQYAIDKNQELTELNDTANERIRRLEDDVLAFENKQQQNACQVAQLKHELATSQQKSSDTQDEIDMLKSKLRSLIHLETQQKQLADENSQLQNEIDSMKQQSMQSKTETEMLCQKQTQEITELKLQLESLTVECSGLQESRVFKQERYKKRLQQYEEENQSLHSKVNFYATEYNKLKDQVNLLSEKVFYQRKYMIQHKKIAF